MAQANPRERPGSMRLVLERLATIERGVAGSAPEGDPVR
jgi:hypothetical protein